MKSLSVNQLSTAIASWNGQIMPLDEVQVPALDRGFLFGDAVYEVVRVMNNQPVYWTEHARRFEAGLEAIRMPSMLPSVQNQMNALLAQTRCPHGILYLHVTRGLGPRKHAFLPSMSAPNVLIFVQPIDNSEIRRRQHAGTTVALLPDLRWKRPDIKSPNLLPNCLAVQEAIEQQATEALLVNEKSEVTEGACSNVFLVCEGQLITPPLEQRILAGVTRDVVLKLARRMRLPVIERTVTCDELLAADEVFLTSTSIDVMPVVRINQSLVGSGQPGLLTQRLAAALQDDLRAQTSVNRAA